MDNNARMTPAARWRLAQIAMNEGDIAKAIMDAIRCAPSGLGTFTPEDIDEIMNRIYGKEQPQKG